MIPPTPLPYSPAKSGSRLAAAGGGALLGALLGGLTTFNILIAVYSGQAHAGNDSIGAGIAAGITLIAVTVIGMIVGAAAGGALLAWLAGRSNTRTAAIVLAACGYIGAAISLMGAAVWWMRLQSTARQDIDVIQARDARKQAELKAMDAQRNAGLPQRLDQSTPATDPQTAQPAPPDMFPQPPARAPQPAPDPQSAADPAASVRLVYGNLSYPNITETRIAPSSSRPSVPAAVVLQMTTDPLDQVMAYYKVRLQLIRQSRMEFLGSGKRPGDGAQTFIHVRQGDAGYVYIELSAG